MLQWILKDCFSNFPGLWVLSLIIAIHLASIWYYKFRIKLTHEHIQKFYWVTSLLINIWFMLVLFRRHCIKRPKVILVVSCHSAFTQRRSRSKIRIRIWMYKKIKIVKGYSRLSGIVPKVKSSLWIKQNLLSITVTILKAIAGIDRINPVSRGYWKPSKYIHKPDKESISGIFDDALKNLISFKQKFDEGLIDNTTIFESMQDIGVAHLGGLMNILRMIENYT